MYFSFQKKKSNSMEATNLSLCTWISREYYTKEEEDCKNNIGKKEGKQN